MLSSTGKNVEERYSHKPLHCWKWTETHVFVEGHWLYLSTLNVFRPLGQKFLFLDSLLQKCMYKRPRIDARESSI